MLTALWLLVAQGILGAFAARQAVSDDTDGVATRRLAAGEVHDMTEQAADRRTEYVQDRQRPVICAQSCPLWPASIPPGPLFE